MRDLGRITVELQSIEDQVARAKAGFEDARTKVEAVLPLSEAEADGVDEWLGDIAHHLTELSSRVEEFHARIYQGQNADPT